MAQGRHFRLSRWVGRRLRSDSTATPPPPARRRAVRRAGALASSAALALGVLGLPAQAASPTPVKAAAAEAAAAVKVLVFHGPAAQQDDPVARAADRDPELGADNGFTVDDSSRPGRVHLRQPGPATAAWCSSPPTA